MAAALGAVPGRAAEDLAEPGRDVLRVVRVHSGEDRGEESVLGDLLVEPGEEPVEGLRPAGPLVQVGTAAPRPTTSVAS